MDWFASKKIGSRRDLVRFLMMLDVFIEEKESRALTAKSVSFNQ